VSFWAERIVLEEDTGGCGMDGSSEADGVYSCPWGSWSATATDFSAELVSPFLQGDNRSERCDVMSVGDGHLSLVRLGVVVNLFVSDVWIHVTRPGRNQYCSCPLDYGCLSRRQMR
jgi:hypothetical protein